MATPRPGSAGKCTKARSQPTIPRFHEVAAVVADTGCSFSRGPRQISESTNSFAFLSALRPLRWSSQVEMGLRSGSVGKRSHGPRAGTWKREADNGGRFWWWSWRGSDRSARRGPVLLSLWSYAIITCVLGGISEL